MKVTEKIENYANLSAEEKLAALESLELGEDKTADYEKDIAKYKDLMQKANSQAADFKKKLAEKQTEDERLEAERAEKEAEKDALLKSLMRDRDIATYRAKLVDIGLPDELAGESAEKICDNDISGMLENFKSFLAERDKAIKAEVLKQSPKPIPGGNGDKTMTVEQFRALGYKDRVALANSNPTLFAELSKI